MNNLDTKYYSKMKTHIQSIAKVLLMLFVLQINVAYAQVNIEPGNFYSQNGKAKLYPSDPGRNPNKRSLKFENVMFYPSTLDYRCIKGYYKELDPVWGFPSRYSADKTEDGWEVILANSMNLNKLIKFEKQDDTYRNISVYGTDKDEIKSKSYSDDELTQIVVEFEKEYAEGAQALIDKDNELMIQEQEEEISKLKLDPAYIDDPEGDKIVRRDYNRESQELMLWRIAQKSNGKKRDYDEYEIKRVISGNPDSWGGVVNEYGTIVGRHRTVMIIYSYEGKCTWMKGEIRKSAIGNGEFGEPYLYDLTTIGRVPCNEFLGK